MIIDPVGLILSFIFIKLMRPNKQLNDKKFKRHQYHAMFPDVNTIAKHMNISQILYNRRSHFFEYMKCLCKRQKVNVKKFATVDINLVFFHNDNNLGIAKVSDQKNKTGRELF